MTPIIKLDQIDKTYQMGENQLRVLNKVSLEIEAGDFVAIMGPSGSGKSTLLNMIGCLDVPSQGNYSFDGVDLSKLSETELTYIRRFKIGFIFQQFNLLNYMSALENVALPLLYTEGKMNKTLASSLLEQVGLSDRQNHLPRELSGGQQQRVAIARALVNQPKLILADEPTGNLDSQSEEQVLYLLEELNKKGFTIVMVTHEDAVASRCRRIVRMRDGKIVSDQRLKDYPTDHRSKESKTNMRAPGSLPIKEHLEQGFLQLLSNKMRTFLSILGVLIGVTSVVTMMAIGKGAKESIENQLSTLGANILVLRSGAIRMGGASTEAGVLPSIYPEDGHAVKEKFPAIKEVAPNVQGRAQVTFGNKNWNTSIFGVTPQYEYLRSYKPEIGRFFTVEENRRRARVAVIGATVHRELFGGKPAVGEMIKINKNNYLIIGILPEKGATGWRDQDDVVMVPLLTGMKRLLGKLYVDAIDFQVEKNADMNLLQDDILEFMNNRHRVPEKSREDAFMIHNMADIQAAIAGSSKTMSLLLTIIATISLLVGGIGIMNIMLVSVTERTREIGLRKALGATHGDILFQFLVESIVVGVLGGMSGIGLGLIFSFLLNTFSGWATSFSLGSLTLSFIFSFIIGLIFGVYPARSAARLHPITALKAD